MNIFNWNKYNSNLKLVKKLLNYNKKNKFNYLEDGLYNHIRDLFCLSSVLTFNYISKTKKLNILDYGSNLISYSNLSNKINLNNFKISIFDPFNKNNKFKIKNVKIYKNANSLKKKWDMINFGSSIQYINNLELLNKINFNHTKVILITHTPFSLDNRYQSKQINNKNLIQNIYPYSKIISFFNKKKFKLIFKSRNEDKYISAFQKYKTFSLNLLFIKK
mgnify:CR=1 FL=1|tara:strand:- start:73 stop:729 length:657 start_codon:yes stop_codon:yes gene_type:complete